MQIQISLLLTQSTLILKMHNCTVKSNFSFFGHSNGALISSSSEEPLLPGILLLLKDPATELSAHPLIVCITLVTRVTKVVTRQ